MEKGLVPLVIRRASASLTWTRARLWRRTKRDHLKQAYQSRSCSARTAGLSLLGVGVTTGGSTSSTRRKGGLQPTPWCIARIPRNSYKPLRYVPLTTKYVCLTRGQQSHYDRERSIIICASSSATQPSISIWVRVFANQNQTQRGHQPLNEARAKAEADQNLSLTFKQVYDPIASAISKGSELLICLFRFNMTFPWVYEMTYPFLVNVVHQRRRMVSDSRILEELRPAVRRYS